MLDNFHYFSNLDPMTTLVYKIKIDLINLFHFDKIYNALYRLYIKTNCMGVFRRTVLSDPSVE